MIKIFEDFKDMDPYGEEVWDELKTITDIEDIEIGDELYDDLETYEGVITDIIQDLVVVHHDRFRRHHSSATFFTYWLIHNGWKIRKNIKE